MVMGPPVFAPLLFGVSAYLGLLASFFVAVNRAVKDFCLVPHIPDHWARIVTGEHEPISWTQDVREGRFQKQMAIATVISAFFSGFEAWYSHYKNNFRYKAQWTPVIIAPMLMAAGIAAVKSPRVAHTWLPAISAVAIVDGAVGFGYHARGVLRRPGGLKKPIYNIIYGPPLFAPLLFAASGFLGIVGKLAPQRETKMSSANRKSGYAPGRYRIRESRSDPWRSPDIIRDLARSAQQKFWDAKTREVVLDRVNNVPEIRFFSPQEARLLESGLRSHSPAGRSRRVSQDPDRAAN